jgi:hypothetical protein
MSYLYIAVISADILCYIVAPISCDLQPYLRRGYKISATMTLRYAHLAQSHKLKRLKYCTRN